MRLLGKSSVAGFLNGLINVVFVLVVIFVVVQILVFLAAMIDPGVTYHWIGNSTTLQINPKIEVPDLKLRSTDPKSHIKMRKLLGWVEMKTRNRLFLLLVFIPYISWWGLYLLIVAQLRKFFLTLKEGDPFTKDNSRRLRVIGISIIGVEVLKNLTQFGAVIYLKNIISSPYASFSMLNPGFYWEILRLDLIFVGAAVVILSEIFRLGAGMREEQQLTI